MLQSQPSRTAVGAALHRAAHQLVDRPLVFTDPLAVPIAGPEAVRGLRDGSDPRLAMSGLRAFIAARSRLAEDRLAAAHERGVRQYVLLGAGLDTFAYRSELPGLAVYEVDAPASQHSKRDRLVSAGIPVPPSLTFAAVDFERDTVADGLARTGFDPAAPAQFAMLGVAMYLTEQALRRTASFVAALPPGSEIVFDYATANQPTASDGPARSLRERAAAAGEPFMSAWAPGELCRMLTETGFAAVEDFGAAALNDRYFAARADGLAIRSGARIAAASV
jgi:methyltransferase (TIGR00027 family)